MPDRNKRSAVKRATSLARRGARRTARVPHTTAATGWTNIRRRDAVLAATAYVLRRRMIAIAAAALVTGGGAEALGASWMLVALVDLGTAGLAWLAIGLLLAPDPPPRWWTLTHVLGISPSRSREMWRATMGHSNKIKLKLIEREPELGLTPVGHQFTQHGTHWIVRAVEPVVDGHLIACTSGSWPRRRLRLPRLTFTLSLSTPSEATI